MNIRIQSRRDFSCLSLVIAMVLGGLVASFPAFFAEAAAPACTFDRDLQMGVIGDDVKCLQKYLNSNGFVIAETGVGSAGHETGEFKTLTEAAVIKWQKANNLSPAIGYFGARSRAAYTAATSGLVLGASTTTVPEIGSIAYLQAQLAALQVKVATPVPTVPPVSVTTGFASDAASDARDGMSDAMDAIDDAMDAIDDNEDAEDIDDARDSLADARANFTDGVRAYLDGDYSDASNFFDDAMNDADDAMESAESVSEEEEANDALDEARDNYDDAEDEISAAEDDDEETGASEDLMDEATDALDEAETALDGGEYGDALDYIDEANDLIEEALDSIGDE